MNVSPHRLRGPLLASSTVVFLVYAVWTAHTPGQPRTLRDFIFVMGLFGTPFLVFAYSLWALSGISEVAPVSFRESIRGRLAFTGTILGAVSAALLLLLLLFWSYFTEHEHLATIWGIAGMALAIVATVCGIIGSSKFRRAAVLSVLLLPFWMFAAGLLAKALMD